MTLQTLRASSRQADLLELALEQVLACPACQGRLALETSGEFLHCDGCGSQTPLVEGIPVFSPAGLGPEDPQAEEIRFRDRLAKEELSRATPDLLEGVGKHHCVSVMKTYAHRFRNRFSANDWLLDIGTGYAWPWKSAGPGPLIVGIDLSLGNLLLAKKLLGRSPHPVLLVCANASRLPLADRSFSGLWSVQAFQLFPEPVFQRVQAELDRVLRKEFRMELHHLHPAPFYRLLYRLRGKRLHRRGRAGPFETNRLLPEEWIRRWDSFRGGRFKVSTGYSELFFHPELGVRPRPYPSGLERFLCLRAPAFASLFARQGCLRFENR